MGMNKAWGEWEGKPLMVSLSNRSGKMNIDIN
jgi:hypothetical protein